MSECRSNQKKLCGNPECDICWIRSFASSPNVVYLSSNNTIDPWTVYNNSNSIYLLVKCHKLKCSHEYLVTPANINRGSGCPYCCRWNKLLCDDPCCIPCYKNSFISEPLSKYWSDKNMISPRQVTRRSGFEAWFKCFTKFCGHEFKIGIHNIDKNGCSYCAHKILCDDLSCITCFNLSFSSNDLSLHWSPLNNIDPRYVFKTSGDKFIFTCPVDKCMHNFDKRLNHIKIENLCPYCNHRKLCGDIFCDACWDNSFMSNPLRVNWSDRNEIEPHMVFKNSNMKIWFICDFGHPDFETVVQSVNQLNTWCPLCVNKTQSKLHFFLKQLFEVIFDKGVDWCINPETDRPHRFDFRLELYKIINELDGNQHFEDIDHWDSKVEKVVADDVYKMKRALENGYSIIRIYQTDVWFDRNNWQENLLQVIKKYGQPTVIYIGNRYQRHIDAMNR
jgi:hypothetical protein